MSGVTSSVGEELGAGVGVGPGVADATTDGAGDGDVVGLCAPVDPHAATSDVTTITSGTRPGTSAF
jgi:hypothetical protein